MKLKQTTAQLGTIFSPFQNPRDLSPGEKVLFGFITGVFLISGYALFQGLYKTLLIEVPASGGSFTEGIVGTPRFINPVLASSQADKDLTALVFSGLMRINANGELEGALAETYTRSEDDLVYDFTLREEARFHDGSSVTADDVVFTIARIQDPRTKSPLFVHWEGVRAEKISERTVRITLPSPYAPLLYNATVGILPKALWEGVEPEEMPFSTLNSAPIGAGPFMVKSAKRDGSGMPQSFELVRFENYLPQAPFLEHITLSVFQSEEELAAGLTNGDVEAAGALSGAAVTQLPPKTILHQEILPRVFAVFYNQNVNAVFADKSARAALDRVIPKEEIIARALFGYGTALKGPLPEHMLSAFEEISQATTTSAATTSAEKRIEDATAIMEIGGWKKGEDGIWEKHTKKETLRLSFTLTTSEAQELAFSAEDIARVWRAFGADVRVELFEPNALAKEVIRTRKYDALFFGVVVGRGLDLYPFWHSSQRNDPGLNVALYTNIDADKALETLRASSNEEKRTDALRIFLREMKIDAPAAFVFAPAYLYVLPERIHAVSLKNMESAENRFQNVSEWYIETNHIWPFVEELWGK